MTGEWGSTRVAAAAASVHRDRLLALPGVVAVGAGHRIAAGSDTGQVVVVVFVEEKRPAAALPSGAMVPRQVRVADNVLLTDVVEVGVLSAPPAHLAPATPETVLLRAFSRPAKGGASASHWRFPIGTLTLGFEDAFQTGRPLALSCSHVFGLLTTATVGDPVLAPGPVDNGSLWTTLGWYLRSAPLPLDGRTWARADASVAWCPPNTVDEQVAGLGVPTGVRDSDTLALRESVRKVGRTSGLTTGTVTAVGVHARVDYSSLGFAGATALLSDVIMTSPMGGYGDSGSLLLDADDRAVGLLFGGTASVTLFNPMSAVLNGVGARLANTAPELSPVTPSDRLVGPRAAC